MGPLSEIYKEMEEEREGQCEWSGAWIKSQLYNNFPRRDCVVTCPECHQEITLSPIPKMSGYYWICEEHEMSQA